MIMKYEKRLDPIPPRPYNRKKVNDDIKREFCLRKVGKKEVFDPTVSEYMIIIFKGKY
jgi:hypothetical protein